MMQIGSLNVIQMNIPKTLSMLISKEGVYLLWIQRQLSKGI